MTITASIATKPKIDFTRPVLWLVAACLVTLIVLSGFVGSPKTGFRRDKSRRKLVAMLDHAVTGPNFLAPKSRGALARLSSIE